MSSADAPARTFDRKSRLSVLAKAEPKDLLAVWRDWCAAAREPDYRILRTPEIGTVMVRGRAGGVGAPFNLGEMMVTRSSVTLDDGVVGHGYVQGRDKAASLAAALVDGLGQTQQAAAIDAGITAPLAATAAERAQKRADKAAATRVEFFTVARGHD
ncbi:MAG: phosphonate C-P lyase system protein PhnG [Pseudomonadota bacterium]